MEVSHPLTKGRFSILKATLEDSTGSIKAVWFNQPYLERLFRAGMRLILCGKVEVDAYGGGLQLQVRDFEIDTGEPLGIVPIYPLTEGLYPKHLRKIMKQALDKFLKCVEEVVPTFIQRSFRLVDLKFAIQTLHFPSDLELIEAARYRLVFDDFFVFQLGLGLRRQEVKEEKGIAFKVEDDLLKDFKLPFELTTAQKRVIDEIKADMQSDHPMNRLLQGDVGSGKTIVATVAALIAIQNVYQVALMAPTEILAQQHYAKIVKTLKSSKVKMKLLTGTTQKKKKVEEIEKWDLVIGTHALIEEKVKFKKLGLVVIDEQHRFGVLQRAKLKQKGINPDFLFMTATPIPRSLAFVLYGDLDRSVIDEMPPGRTPIKTYYVPESKRAGAYEFMRKELKNGRQVFVVCPLVEESEKVDLKAAMDEAERLQKDIFPEFKVGMIHGRMKGEDKDEIMNGFKKKKTHILVSTTVIEVGIDIPNATVMAIEHAERFGLSQLHQLRGRIGRGAEQSYCFLFSDARTPEAKTRLKAMLDSTDGFHIAEVDLRLRGPGEFYGIRQSGLPNFRVADIIRDEHVLKIARQAAFEFLKQDSKLEREENQPLREAIFARYGKFLGY